MTFQQRLKVAMRCGNLTVADLARWFDRPDPTVRGWVMNGGSPGGGPLDIENTYQALDLLEKIIKRRRDLPLPRMSPSERMKRLNEIQKKFHWQ